MSPSPRDFPEHPTEISSNDVVEGETFVSSTATKYVSPELDKTAITPRPGTVRIKAPVLRRYMLAVATDSGPRMLALADQRLTVGRMEDNALCLRHGSVSRHHAVFELTKSGLTIQDLGSQNGTTINGEPTAGQVSLKPGDIVRIGYVALFYFGFMSPEDPPRVELINQPLALTPHAPEPG